MSSYIVVFYLLGTFESTFSFRIREDRQLMGFSREDTYNQLCGSKDNESDHTSCAPPTYWKMPRGVWVEQAEELTTGAAGLEEKSEL